MKHTANINGESFEIELPFNYGNLTQDHKDAAEEICKILENSNQTSLSDLIKEKFEIKPKNRFDPKDSEFIKFAEKYRIGFGIVGFVADGNQEWPIIGFSEDIRKLDIMFNEIKKTK